MPLQKIRQWQQRASAAIGALPARRVTWGLVTVFALWVLLDVLVLQLTGGLAKSSYDAMVRARLITSQPDPRIVVVDIDEASLARMTQEFGRWPWPRDTLATVLEHIESQQPAAVVWDILFSDADRISPGGDAAFNAAVARSKYSHFSVVRLPAFNDKFSDVTRSALPNFWTATVADAPGSAAKASSVAMIPPALPAVAASRLGFNNGYVDADGVLRRYRYLERLPDGSTIQSLPMSVLRAIEPKAYSAMLAKNAASSKPPPDTLMVWPRDIHAYPHVPFADVFAQAEKDKPLAPVPSFAGKVVVIGATAPSLHDIHATPLYSMQAGVDSLATALDNGLNQRHPAELPNWLQAALAIGLCVALALWVQFKSVSSLAPALLVLPGALLGASYLSLNGLPVFIDLHLAAGLALVFLALLRAWSNLRWQYWCSPPDLTQPLSLWSWHRPQAWLDDALDRLIDALERHAPDCRVVSADVSRQAASDLRWPELARFVAIVGPAASLQAARVQLEPLLNKLADRCGQPEPLAAGASRQQLAQAALSAWQRLALTDAAPRRNNN